MEWYSILGLDPSQRERISLTTIKKQYHHLAKQYHPDKCADEDAKERFIQIHMAYEILSDSQKRAFYDESLGKETDDEWWQLFLQKHIWFNLFYSDFKELKSDLHKFQSRRDIHDYSAYQNLIYKSAQQLKCNIDWSQDIILQLRISQTSLGKKHTIEYVRYTHQVVGVVISFSLTTEKITIELPEEYDYSNELLTISNMGNEYLEAGKVKSGDLNLDINFI